MEKFQAIFWVYSIYCFPSTNSSIHAFNNHHKQYPGRYYKDFKIARLHNIDVVKIRLVISLLYNTLQ